MHLYALTDDVNKARAYEHAGVSRIFLDLETLNKKIRQPSGDTVISQHRIENIQHIVACLTSAELMVRVDPWNENSPDQIKDVVDRGAKLIMLPMFRTLEEVVYVADLIRGKAKLIPLCETIESLTLIDSLCKLEAVAELHIGLNDLHLQRKDRFMFEVLLSESFSQAFEQTTKPIGFGGVSTLERGLVPGKLVLSEHVYRNSSGVILSRSFIDSSSDLAEDISQLRHWQQKLQDSPTLLAETRHRLHQAIRSVASENG